MNLAKLFSCLVLLPTAASANLLANGSFELGNYNNLDPDPRPEIMLVTPGMTNILGWTPAGSAGVHWINSGAQDASHGLYWLDIQGTLPGELSSISTSFTTSVGTQYDLSFDSFAGNLANTATVSAGSLQNQAFLGNAAPLGPPFGPIYQRFAYVFTAISPTTTLTFRVTSTDGFGPAIDNVSVTAVPEPSQYLLFMLGIAALLLKLRRREA